MATELKMVVTQKDDKRNRREYFITGLEIHPEIMTIRFVETKDLNRVRKLEMKTNFDYFIHMGY